MTFCSKVLLMRMSRLLKRSLKKKEPIKASIAQGKISARPLSITSSTTTRVIDGKTKEKESERMAQPRVAANIPLYGRRYAETRRTTSEVGRALECIDESSVRC